MTLACRPGCGACCIAPSINSALPGMALGKPAGERCLHLDANNLCSLFGRPERPGFCSGLPPEVEMCGLDANDALRRLNALEAATRPEPR